MHPLGILKQVDLPVLDAAPLTLSILINNIHNLKFLRKLVEILLSKMS